MTSRLDRAIAWLPNDSAGANASAQHLLENPRKRLTYYSLGSVCMSSFRPSFSKSRNHYKSPIHSQRVGSQKEAGDGLAVINRAISAELYCLAKRHPLKPDDLMGIKRSAHNRLELSRQIDPDRLG